MKSYHSVACTSRCTGGFDDIDNVGRVAPHHAQNVDAERHCGLKITAIDAPIALISREPVP